MASAPPERRLAAILFTDIVGYTAWMVRDEEGARRARDRHEAVVRPLVEAYRGEWVERTGDETLSAFRSALDAVNCALAVQAALAGEPELRLRAGIHHGDVTFDTAGVSGDGVNVAARVRPLAEPGGICISGDVHQSVRGRTGLEFEALGQQDFKNVDHPVAVFSVSGTADAPRSVSETVPAARPTGTARVKWAAGVAVAVAIATGWWFYGTESEITPIRSLAVLPLDNLSGDPEQEYFSDGMTEALIASLVRVSPELRVISRTSVMQYKETRKTIPEIARELGVAGVIEGSAIREGDRVRVTVQLVDGRSDVHLWAHSFEREFESALALQGEVAREVAGQIRLKLLPERLERLAGLRPVVPVALDSYMRGMQHLQMMTVPDAEEAIALFEQATREDPEFAKAYAYLGRAYVALSVQLGAMSWAEAAPKMAEASERALALDDSLALARVVQARVRLSRDWNWEAAGTSYARALELEPSNTYVHHEYSDFLVISGHVDEGLALGRRAVETAPLDLDRRQHLCWLHYAARLYERALLECEQILADHPEFAKPHEYLFYVHQVLGNSDAAMASLRSFVTLASFPEGADMLRAMDLGVSEGGNTGGLRALGLWNEEHGAIGRAAIFWAAGGEHERAIDLLEEAFANRSFDLKLLPVLHNFDPLHSDPRFQAMLRQVNHPRARDESVRVATRPGASSSAKHVSPQSGGAGPWQSYVLHCQGCHLEDGRETPGKVPALDGTGRFLAVAGGREYLVRVPGVVQAPIGDAELAALMNWVVERFGGEETPGDFHPYTEAEVAELRRHTLDDPERVRSALVAALEARSLDAAHAR